MVTASAGAGHECKLHIKYMRLEHGPSDGRIVIATRHWSCSVSMLDLSLTNKWMRTISPEALGLQFCRRHSVSFNRAETACPMTGTSWAMVEQHT